MAGRRRRRNRTIYKSGSILGTNVILYSALSLLLLYIIVTHPWVFWVATVICSTAYLLPKYIEYRKRDVPALQASEENKTPTTVGTDEINNIDTVEYLKILERNTSDNEALKRKPRRVNEDLEHLQNRVRRMDPYKFETYVARAFEASGWKAHSTKGSGDFGADVVAERMGVKIVVQVKKYQSNVSLGAVQEVAASRYHYKADFAIVLTSASGYTTSAKRLAESNGVLLWTLEELKNLQSGKTPEDLLELMSLPGEDVV